MDLSPASRARHIAILETTATRLQASILPESGYAGVIGRGAEVFALDARALVLRDVALALRAHPHEASLVVRSELSIAVQQALQISGESSGWHVTTTHALGRNPALVRLGIERPNAASDLLVLARAEQVLAVVNETLVSITEKLVAERAAKTGTFSVEVTASREVGNIAHELLSEMRLIASSKGDTGWRVTISHSVTDGAAPVRIQVACTNPKAR